MIHQSDAALLVELIVTKRRKQFLAVLKGLKARGWNIVSTPRDAEFGVGAYALPDSIPVSEPDDPERVSA